MGTGEANQRTAAHDCSVGQILRRVGYHKLHEFPLICWLLHFDADQRLDERFRTEAVGLMSLPNGCQWLRVDALAAHGQNTDYSTSCPRAMTK